jgi:hypothetical protein
MPEFNPPPAFPGFFHFESTFVNFSDIHSRREYAGWIYGIVDLETGATFHACGPELIEIAPELDARGLLPVFGGRS